jgi:hypothetical protein
MVGDRRTLAVHGETFSGRRTCLCGRVFGGRGCDRLQRLWGAQFDGDDRGSRPDRNQWFGHQRWGTEHGRFKHGRRSHGR